MKNGDTGFLNAFLRCHSQFSSTAPHLDSLGLTVAYAGEILYPLFLFVLVTEVLTCFLKRGEALGGLHGI